MDQDSANILLALYALYRYKDKDTLQLATANDQTPAFVRSAFTAIELNQRIRWLFKIEDQPNDNLQFVGEITPAVNEQDYVTIGQAFKHSAEAIRTQINLLEQLPRRNVFVERKVHYVRDGDRQKCCYSILTQIGKSRFESLRTIEELGDLYSSLKELFSPQNFPKLNLPVLRALTVDENGGVGYDTRQRADLIESWIDSLFKTPIFLSGEVLSFLNISGEQAAPFLTYFQNSYKLFCSKHYLLLLRKKESPNRVTVASGARQLSGYFDRQAPVREETDHQKLMKLLTHSLQFTINSQNQADQSSYNFLVSCLVDGRTRFNWSLTKSQDQMMGINQRIQQQCNMAVPFFYQLTSRRRGKYSEQLQVYRLYIQSLLDTTRYYCTSLFFFISFDPIRLEINTTGARLSFKGIQQERRSRYLSEYEDKGSFIQVTRVDRTGKNTFTGEDQLKFKVRRGGLLLTGKTSEQVKQLRQKLAQLYKGVSFVPDIDFKGCHKAEAKAKIQNFLLKIENLPKIQVNRDYLSFYENSIYQK